MRSRGTVDGGYGDMATPVICYMPLSEGGVVPPGPPTFMAECGLEPLPTTQSYVDVLFMYPKPDTNYSLDPLSVENNVDAHPDLIWVTLITDRTLTGFRAWFNANAPTTNYQLRWCVSTETPLVSLPSEVNVMKFGDSFRIRGITGGVVFETFSSGVWTIVNTIMA